MPLHTPGEDVRGRCDEVLPSGETAERGNPRPLQTHLLDCTPSRIQKSFVTGTNRDHRTPVNAEANCKSWGKRHEWESLGLQAQQTIFVGLFVLEAQPKTFVFIFIFFKVAGLISNPVLLFSMLENHIIERKHII